MGRLGADPRACARCAAAVRLPEHGAAAARHVSRDILYQAELAAGQGVIRDVVEVASDAGAPLAEKMALYGAAATMTPHDRERLDGMIAAVEARSTYPMLTGPGTPIETTLAPSPDPTEPSSPVRLRAVSGPRSNSRTRRRGSNPAKTATVERQVRAAWTGPGMTVGQLEKAAKISKNSASKWRKVLLAEAEHQATWLYDAYTGGVAMELKPLYKVGDVVHWSQRNGNESEGRIIRILRRSRGEPGYVVEDEDPEIPPVTVNESSIDGLV